MKNIVLLTQAISELVPNAEVVVSGDCDITWINPTVAPVSDKQIDEKYNQLVLQNKFNAYKEQRRVEYPSVVDQLDMLWHSIDQGTLDKNSPFYTSILEVKNNYPKPSA